MSRCNICNADLDGELTAFAPAEVLGMDPRRWAGGDVCLPCGAAVGGTIDNDVRLTPTGVAEAMATLAKAASAVADLIEGGLTADELLEKYRHLRPGEGTST